MFGHVASPLVIVLQTFLQLDKAIFLPSLQY
jgi:hypothetical protein